MGSVDGLLKIISDVSNPMFPVYRSGDSPDYLATGATGKKSSHYLLYMILFVDLYHNYNYHIFQKFLCVCALHVTKICFSLHILVYHCSTKRLFSVNKRNDLKKVKFSSCLNVSLDIDAKP